MPLHSNMEIFYDDEYKDRKLFRSDDFNNQSRLSGLSWHVTSQPGVSPCRSESGGSAGNGSSNCQQAGSLASSASPTPRFAPTHHTVLQGPPSYACPLHFAHGLAQ